MKEEYYSAGTVDRQAEAFLDQVRSLRDRRLHSFRWQRSGAALLVLDMQDYFLTESSHAFVPSAKAVVPRIGRLQDTFFSRGLPVIQTRHLNTPANAGQMATWWSELLAADDPLSAVTAGLADSRAAVLDKAQYDAFFETGLEDLLRARGTTQVAITGVMAHLCCETTARSAFMRGFEVLFVIDATATYNRQFHAATLLNLAHGFAIPMLAREVVSLFHGCESGT